MLGLVPIKKRIKASVRIFYYIFFQSILRNIKDKWILGVTEMRTTIFVFNNVSCEVLLGFAHLCLKPHSQH